MRPLAAVIAATAMGCLAPAFPTRADDAAPLASIELPPELQRVLTDYETAWGNRDPAALAALFSEDGFVLPGGRPPVRGREAIARYYTGHGGPLALRAFAFGQEGAVGYILGGYAGSRGQPDEGKFTLTLRRSGDGRWLIFSDMDNSNRPPTPPPAPVGSSTSR